MAAETDARCQGDARKLSFFFEKLGASSLPGTYTGYTPVVFMGQNDFGGPVARGSASVDKRQCVPCNECFKLHPPYSYCPYTPCDICDRVHPLSARCPYFYHLPQGATFPRGYEIICQCGNAFNEEKWACSCCGGSMPVLKAKYCSICNVWYQHCVYECPEDQVLAAEYKSIRDKMLSRVPIPHRPLYPESSSGIPYVPTTPSSLVCGDMKEGKDSVDIPEALSGMTYSPTARPGVYEDMNIGTPWWKPIS